MRHNHHHPSSDAAAAAAAQHHHSLMMMAAAAAVDSTSSVPSAENRLKLPLGSSSGFSSAKERNRGISSSSSSPPYLAGYARKLGVNDRGCYLACGLAALALALFLVVVILVANWPGKRVLKNLFLSVFTVSLLKIGIWSLFSA